MLNSALLTEGEYRLMDTRPIGVFDSGVGGISVLRTLRQVLPRERFIYIGDTRNAPYGTKTEEEVYACALQVMERLLSLDVKAVVIACNTATSAAAARLRAAYTLPIIGMEPALKPAHELRHGGLILVLATPVTLALPKFQALYARYGEGAIPLPCPGLMNLVEQEDFDGARDYLTQVLAPYREQAVDAIVLGCTHYSFLRPVLREMLSEDIAIVDGNLGTARQLQRVLAFRDLLAPENQLGSCEMRTSGDPTAVLPIMKRLYERAQ